MTIATHTQPATIATNAVRLDNCINGNPRYYLQACDFTDVTGALFRPAHVKAYRGKRFGAGWVISSYSLENDIRDAIAAVELQVAS